MGVNLKVTRICKEIRSRIDKGRLATGARLPTVAALSKTYAASRTTVTEALKALEKDGLVFRMKGSGVYVKKPEPSSKDLQAAFSSAIKPRAQGIADEITSGMTLNVLARGFGTTESVLLTYLRLPADTSPDTRIRDLEDIVEALTTPVVRELMAGFPPRT